MMCLGWNTKPTCDARPDVQVVAGSDGGACPDITWFWALAAAIGLGALMKSGKGKNEGARA